MAAFPRPMDYVFVRTVHIATVHVSLALFLLRGFWMLRESPRLQDRWVRALPHVNDTLLLVAAIAMLVMASLNPLEQPWIMAKIIGLLAYIGIGTVALKRGRTRALRIKALVAAVGIYAYIVAVAVTKQVLPGVAR